MNYRIEWIWPVAALGALTLLVVPVLGPMLALAVVVIVALAMLFALVGALVAMPFLVVRAVHRGRRSGRARPAYIAQARVRKASRLTAAGKHAAVPEAPAPVR